MQDPRTLTELIRDAALTLGFVRVGFTPATGLQRDAAALQAWLDAGYQGDMRYMAEHGRRDAPHQVDARARTLVVVALPYAAQEGHARPEAAAPQDDVPRGIIARYARGADYHTVMREKLYRLADACEAIVGHPVAARPCVDTAPLLERGYAARAGVGFAAKSTLSIVPGFGTYMLLGELLLDLELDPSEPLPSKCGTCSLCMQACPTNAFVGPHVLDARRCISYLTIELRGAIPRELRAKMGAMVFGCDICQEVCPYNASKKPKPQAPELHWRDTLTTPSLVELLHLGAAAHRKLVKGTAMRRASREQLSRNAAVALGNSGSQAAVAPLSEALKTSRYALVRGHAAWALGQLGGEAAHRTLTDSLSCEDHVDVREEITAALNQFAMPQTMAPQTNHAAPLPTIAPPPHKPA